MHTHTKYLDFHAERHYHKQAFEIIAGHNHKRFLNCEHTSVRFQQEELCVYWRTLLASILSGVIWGQLSPQLYLSALHSPAAASSCSSLTCHHQPSPARDWEPDFTDKFFYLVYIPYSKLIGWSSYSKLWAHLYFVFIHLVFLFVFSKIFWRFQQLFLSTNCTALVVE